jgi:hypothetical protein
VFVKENDTRTNVFSTMPVRVTISSSRTGYDSDWIYKNLTITHNSVYKERIKLKFSNVFAYDIPDDSELEFELEPNQSKVISYKDDMGRSTNPNEFDLKCTIYADSYWVPDSEAETFKIADDKTFSIFFDWQ